MFGISLTLPEYGFAGKIYDKKYLCQIEIRYLRRAKCIILN